MGHFRATEFLGDLKQVTCITESISQEDFPFYSGLFGKAVTFRLIDKFV
jgi:hypothetical protein